MLMKRSGDDYAACHLVTAGAAAPARMPAVEVRAS
jgi:hypothetical protein